MAITCTDFCRALADDTRQEILRMLQKREMSVGEIVEAFSISQPTISHHLSILKSMDLVVSRREGKQIFYATNQENIAECCGMLFAKFIPARRKRARVAVSTATG